MMLCMRWAMTLWLCVGCGDGKATADAEDSAAPADSGAAAEISGCEGVGELSWDNWGRSFFRTWCAGCHAADAPDRHGAPDTIVFDTESQVFDQRTLIRDSVLESGRMPLGGGLPDAEAEILDLYLRCGLDD